MCQKPISLIGNMAFKIIPTQLSHGRYISWKLMPKKNWHIIVRAAAEMVFQLIAWNA